MQQVLKLEKKKLVERYMKDEDNKKVFLKLSEAGNQAALGHTRFHEIMYRDLYKLLRNLSMENLELISRIFSTVETHIDSYLQEKKMST